MCLRLFVVRTIKYTSHYSLKLLSDGSRLEAFPPLAIIAAIEKSVAPPMQELVVVLVVLVKLRTKGRLLLLPVLLLRMVAICLELVIVLGLSRVSGFGAIFEQLLQFSISTNFD